MAIIGSYGNHEPMSKSFSLTTFFKNFHNHKSDDQQKYFDAQK